MQFAWSFVHSNWAQCEVCVELLGAGVWVRVPRLEVEAPILSLSLYIYIYIYVYIDDHIILYYIILYYTMLYYIILYYIIYYMYIYIYIYVIDRYEASAAACRGLDRHLRRALHQHGRDRAKEGPAAYGQLSWFKIRKLSNWGSQILYTSTQ